MLASEHDVELAETSRRGHATRLARGAPAEGFDVVAVLGGDGTLNEAANGLAGTPTALAPLPGGSTNVFARTIGLPNDPVEAAESTLESLRRSSITPFGLGSVDARYFLFHVGIGLDAAVVARVERYPSLKRWAGHPLFIASTLLSWSRDLDRANPAMTLHLGGPDRGVGAGNDARAGGDRSEADAGPGDEVVGGGYLAIVSNTTPYTFVGNHPLVIAPDADPDRGLSVTMVRTIRLAPFLGLMSSMFRSGARFRTSRHALHRAGVGHLDVRCDPPLHYQVDGDHLGEVDRLVFRHEPGAIRLVRPVVTNPSAPAGADGRRAAQPDAKP